MKNKVKIPEAYAAITRGRKGLAGPREDFINAIPLDKTDRLLKTSKVGLSELIKSLNLSFVKDELEKLEKEQRQFQSRSIMRTRQVQMLTSQMNFGNNAIEKLTVPEIEIQDLHSLKSEYYGQILNYTQVPVSIDDFSVKSILKTKKPDYIPYLNEEVLLAKSFVPDVLRIGNDAYLLTEKYSTKPEDNHLYVLTLTQVTLCVEYYINKAKAHEVERAERKRDALRREYGSKEENARSVYYHQKIRYQDLPAAKRKNTSMLEWSKLSLKEKEAIHHPVDEIKVRRVSVSFGRESNKMPASYHSMYEAFVNPEAKLRGRYANPEVFNYFSSFKVFIKWKLNDLAVARQVDSNMHNKAFQTSYGHKGASKTLLAKYGVLIKRQDGSAVRPIELQDIDLALERVLETYGDFSPWLRKDNLVFSHADKKHMYARSAIGLFVPNIPAVGVSRLGGQNQFFSTASHEFAHYLDYKQGKGGWFNMASWDYESTAGKIAHVFKENMKDKKSASDYINATHECFARAMQQYFTMKYFPTGEFGYFSFVHIEQPRVITDTSYYCSKEVFNSTVEPLIQQFLKELKVPKYKKTTTPNKSTDSAKEKHLRMLSLKYRYAS